MTTRLNGKSPNSLDNSMLNQSTPHYSTANYIRQQPGVYVILCLANDYRYYGESTNLSGRIASHKSKLRRKIHENTSMQEDWLKYGESCFEFKALYIGTDWVLKETRLSMEYKLISQDKERCYNVFESFEARIGNLNPFYKKRHSEKTKQLMSLAKKGIPNHVLGALIEINGKRYPSIAEASRSLGHARKTIRARVDSIDFAEWKRVSDC